MKVEKNQSKTRLEICKIFSTLKIIIGVGFSTLTRHVQQIC
jgi:hypothetical protein